MTNVASTRVALATVAVVCWMCGVAAVAQVPATTTATAPAEQLATATTTSAPSVLEVAYFYSPTCVKCHEAAKTVEAVEKKYGSKVHVVRRSTEDVAGVDALLAYEERCNAKPSAPPKVFVGRQCMDGLDAIRKRLDTVVAEELALLAAGQATSVPASMPAGESGRVGNLFSSFTTGAVIVAGLIDGVNPCAFTTIVFMLSMLAYLGKSRRDMAIVSVSFTTAVFLTYMALGVGIFVAIKIFMISKGVSQGLAYGMTGFVFILGAWSFIDAFRVARTKKVENATLGLPTSIKNAIHKVIRTGLKTKGLLIGSFGVGCLVSILESICTGQVYLPTIMLMIRSGNSDHRWVAFAYLVLYNLMFILPLVVLTALSYWGVGSQRLGIFFKENLVTSKVLMGVLFVGLGILLVLTI